VTNKHMTKTERAIREAFPEMPDSQVQNLRLLSVLKQAVDKELADGTPADSKGVRQVFMDMEEIVDAHVCAIAYYMGLSSIADCPENIIAFALEVARQLIEEIHGARQAFKAHVASGAEMEFNIIDANLMAQGSTANN
jgi:hypothetical protein